MEQHGRDELLAPASQQMRQEASSSDRYAHLQTILENSRLLGAETLSALNCQRDVWHSADSKLDEVSSNPAARE
jgi:hypothetical protein